jgi:hypothetical protein
VHEELQLLAAPSNSQFAPISNAIFFVACKAHWNVSNLETHPFKMQVHLSGLHTTGTLV